VSTRVFKYANKGYGIRILPSYLEALAKIDPDELPKRNLLEHGKMRLTGGEKQFSLEARIANAREYFERVFRGLHALVEQWKGPTTKLYLWGMDGTSLRPTGQGLPVFTHALLDTRDQLTSQPQSRSCLTGFELLYRLAFGHPCTHILITV
jgi:hypothetical protein